jgi:hypothetical protein
MGVDGGAGVAVDVGMGCGDGDAVGVGVGAGEETETRVGGVPAPAGGLPSNPAEGFRRDGVGVGAAPIGAGGVVGRRGAQAAADNKISSKAMTERPECGSVMPDRGLLVKAERRKHHIAGRGPGAVPRPAHGIR